jgi:hypothetical protein
MEIYLRKKNPGFEKYYTEEYPSGPWSRALFQMRTKKIFDEKDFRDSGMSNESRENLECDALT